LGPLTFKNFFKKKKKKNSILFLVFLKKFLETFLVRQAPSHSFGTKGMAVGPPT
jgi:hypothetical protein